MSDFDSYSEERFSVEDYEDEVKLEEERDSENGSKKEELGSNHDSDYSQMDDQEREKEVLNKMRILGENEFKESSERITPRFLTKYERTRIIGTRALQLTKNAPALVELDNEDSDPIAIAERELVSKKLPFVIRRFLPNGNYEDWRVSELTILDRY